MVSRPPPLPPVRGLDPASLTAWEGRVTSVIQLQGCNFHCPECPVPHLVPPVFGSGTIPVESVLEAIERRRRWLDGVVIAGGEPTLHEGLRELVRYVGETGLRVRLHTNGSRPEMLRTILEGGEVASVSMTVRGPLDPTYAVAVGARVSVGSADAVAVGSAGAATPGRLQALSTSENKAIRAMVVCFIKSILSWSPLNYI